MEDFEKVISYPVIKHNDLIQKARYNLTVNQQKLIAYVISLIKKEDEEFSLYEISVADFCELCGINKTYFYTEFMDLLIDLDKKSFLVEDDEEVYNFRWFSEFKYVKGRGMVKLLLNSNLKKYLIGLSEKYTRYELYNILAIRGKYSIRLYELFKSYFKSKLQKHREREIELDELKTLLIAENYTDYRDFRRRVLEPSLKEINNYTDLTVSISPVKSGRNIKSLKLTIDKKPYPSNYAAYIKTIDRINRRNKQIKGQISIFDLEQADFSGGIPEEDIITITDNRTV